MELKKTNYNTGALNVTHNKGNIIENGIEENKTQYWFPKSYT